METTIKSGLLIFILFISRSMQGKKNDFSMTFYHHEKKRLFLEFVHNTEKAIKWVNDKQIVWSHCMVYERRTREKIERIINCNFER